VEVKRIQRPFPAIAGITGKWNPSRLESERLEHIMTSLNTLTWTTASPLSRPRWGGAAFNISQQIWVLGGCYEDGSLADIEIIDLTTGGRSIIARPFTAFDQAFVASSERIYSVGGFQGCLSLTARVEAYDPATGAIKQKADLPTPCGEPAIASTQDDKIYVMGGFLPPVPDAQGNVAGPSAVLDTVQIYDPVLNSWSAGAPMPLPRAQSSAVTGPDGNIYVIGGYETITTDSNRVDVYNPKTNKWQSPAAPMPTSRRCLAAVLGSDNRIYAIGGLADCDSLSNVEIFDPAANSWGTSSSLATGRWYLAADRLCK